MKKRSKLPRAATRKVSVSASLSDYVEYLAWRSYRDGFDSDDLRNYEEDERLDVEDLWSDYWYAWHRLMLHAAYSALDEEHRNDKDVLVVMKGARGRYMKILKSEAVPSKIDYEKRGRVFSGTKWVPLQYTLPGAPGKKLAERFWKKLDAK
jgi:hypothetical protein